MTIVICVDTDMGHTQKHTITHHGYNHSRYGGKGYHEKQNHNPIHQEASGCAHVIFIHFCQVSCHNSYIRRQSSRRPAASNMCTDASASQIPPIRHRQTPE